MERAAKRIAMPTPSLDRTALEDSLADTNYLADYRAAVERLRGEAAAEVGGQPMLPEALSTIAVMLASLPLLATFLPAIPLEPNGWQQAGALFVVWLVAFRIQSQRYARFHDCWRRKVVAHTAAAIAVRPPAPRYPRAG